MAPKMGRHMDISPTAVYDVGPLAKPPMAVWGRDGAPGPGHSRREGPLRPAARCALASSAFVLVVAKLASPSVL